DQHFVTGEPASVFRQFGRLAEAAAVVEFHDQEIAEQRGITRVGRIAEEFLDPRPIVRAPGGLEPVARLVNIAADPGRVVPVFSSWSRVQTQIPIPEGASSTCRDSGRARPGPGRFRYGLGEARPRARAAVRGDAWEICRICRSPNRPRPSGP